MDYNIITTDISGSNNEVDIGLAAEEEASDDETISDIFYEEQGLLPIKRKLEFYGENGENDENNNDIVNNIENNCNNNFNNNSIEVYDPIVGIIFTESESILPLIPEYVEQNKIIRIVITKIPESLNARLDILNKYRIYSESNNYKPEYIQIGGIVLSEYVSRIIKAHQINLRIKYAFKKMLQLYRIKKIVRSYKPELDIITLEPPHNPVTIYDIKLKRKFIFSAKSLSNSISASLTYSQDTFPEPKEPKNINTNKAFSYEQLVSIYYQLKQYGEVSWTLSTLRELDFYLPKWKIYHKGLLTFMSIKKEISEAETLTAKEMIYDFIVSKMEELQENITQTRLNAYEHAIFNMTPVHHYINRFKPLIISFYEAQSFNVDASAIINGLYKEIIKNEDKFIVDIIFTQV